MDSELNIKNLGQFRMSDDVASGQSVREAVNELSSTDEYLRGRIATLAENLDLVQSTAAMTGRQYRGAVESLDDIVDPTDGDVACLISSTDDSYVRTYIYATTTGEGGGLESKWYLFGDDEKVYAVDELPSISLFSVLNVGRLYLLKEVLPGFTKGHFYRVSQNATTHALYWEDFSTIQNIPLNNVSNIRFSFISGTLAVYWNDPTDLVLEGSVVSKWAKTSLVVKQGGYPETPTDGTTLVTTTTRNQYIDSPFISQLDPEVTWYCRFFPQNESGVYTVDTASTSNCFTTSSYSWSLVAKYLEDYDKFNTLLPQAGDTVYLDYIVNDYYLSGSTRVPCNTRQLVVDNIDKLSTVSLPWRVLGYDSNVPLYIKYRCRREGTQLSHTVGSTKYTVSSTDPQTGVITLGEVVNDYVKYDMVYFRNVATGQIDNYMFDGTNWQLYTAFAEYDYLWVSSVDDTLSSFSVFEADGSAAGTSSYMMGADESYGPGWQRTITAGARTYSMSFDFASGIKSYTDTSETVVSVINPADVFGYSNGGAGSNNVYYAPVTLSVSNGKTYKFCGHTMTVQPQNCLNGANGNNTHYNSIQFDASERTYGSIYNTYDVFESALDDYGYYWRDGQELHKIDVYTEGLGGLIAQKHSGHDVYKAMPDGSLKMQTVYFKRNVKYAKKNDDTTYTSLTACFEYASNTAYSVNLYVATFASPSDETPDAIYKVTTAVPATNTNPPATNSAFTLDTTGILDDKKYAVYGRACPTDIAVCLQAPDSNRVSYGCNIYAESNYRQYINNKNGAADAGYKQQSPLDVVSTGGLMNVNGPFLKLSKNGEFVASIVPTVNITVLATAASLQYYRTFKMIGSTYVEHVIDMFWPLAYYETFGSAIDGTVWFKEVLGTDAKRVKYYVNQNGTKGSACTWWLRNPNTGYTYLEYYVYTSGSSNVHTSHNSYGCAPACLIG